LEAALFATSFDKTSAAKTRAIVNRRWQICDLRGIEAAERSAEGEDCAVGFTLMNLNVEHWNVLLAELRLDALQGTRSNGGAGAREQDRKRDNFIECLFLGTHEPDGFYSFSCVQMRSLRRNDHEIGAAHCVSDRHGSCSFKVHDHEGALGRCLFDGIDDGILFNIRKDSQRLRFSRALRPLGQRLVRICVDDRTTPSTSEPGCGQFLASRPVVRCDSI
jgi:hypothetical protein